MSLSSFVCCFIPFSRYLYGIYCQNVAIPFLVAGGEGFLAPIGDKGQFKDFCEQECMSKYEVLHLGKVLEKETLPCSVCKETRLVEQEIIRYFQLLEDQ